MRITTSVRLLCCFIVLALSGTSATASYILYSQNFDDTIATTTSVTGAFSSTIGVQAAIPPGGSGSSGWVGAKIAGTGTANMNFNVDNGGLNAGALYSYGSTSAIPPAPGPPDLERAVGAIASGTNAGGFGVEIPNNTGGTIHEATIMYTGEFWRSSTSSVNTLTFGYSVGAPGSASFLTGAATAFPALDLVGPAPVAANGPLDGDLAVNQSPKMATITGLTWLNGQSLYVRFQDFNDVGNDAGLAVDNFKVIIPEPSSLALLLLAGLSAACIGRWTLR